MRLNHIKTEFLLSFSEGNDIGASVSVWKHGEEVMTLCEGFMSKDRNQRWSTETLAPVFSATKGPSAATLIYCLEQAGLDLESEVRRIWREFPVSGATFGELISHQCGLAGFDAHLQAEDYEGIITAIEQQEPYWEPMTAHGYHPRLGGYMQDECVRRLTGETLGQIWRSAIAAPLDIDFWIGLPPSEDHRVATLYPGKMRPEQLKDGFYAEVGKSGTVVNTAFRSPKGVQGAGEMNKPENWRPGYPAMGGIGSAQALAKFYQATMGHLPDSPFTDSMRAQFNARRVNGQDLVLCDATSFGGGFMMDPLDEAGEKLRNLIGSDESGYGHPGAGGSHAFADPTTGYSFAYVMNQMEVSVLPGEKVKQMLQ